MSKQKKTETPPVDDKSQDGFSLFGGEKKAATYPPRYLIVDYKEGVEKSVRSSIESDIFSLTKDLGWGKKGVTYRILKITDHPHLEPGYAYEIQMNGDGGSYLEMILAELKDKSVRQVWVECTKNMWSFIELKNGALETSFSPLPAEDKDVTITLKGRTHGKLKPLYVDNYIFYYISLVILFMSTLALTGASVFKYVLLDETKKMVNKKYYNEKQYMPIDALRGASSSSTFRLSAVRYNPGKGWYFILEEKEGDIATLYEQKVNPDGTYGPRVKVESKDLRSSAPITSSEEAQ